MSVILSQVPIELRNPFSVLEPEHESSTIASTTNIVYSHTILTKTQSDDDFERASVSSWSVVNSAYASDDEDDDIDEIYMDASAHNLGPMTVSSLGDGFTNISNVKTATSVNSNSALPDTWVIKVSKSRQTSSKPRTAAAAAPTLEDVIERYECDDDDLDLQSGGDLVPMSSMSEHELSKSSKAVKLKNIRLATAHDIALCKALNITAKKANGGPRMPKNKGKGEKTRNRTVEL
ncbi:hypothetical protein B0O80DRAFT_469349, partial [Mortierella sp. GBAus27b]